jgi:hypothetical protein
VILILGFLHIPLPQIDYHNVRHHDGAGEVCPHHDHLLRWHPSASQDDDLAILHWHWFLPSPDGSDRRAGDDDRSGPFLHAHLPDFVEPDCPLLVAIRPDPSGRCTPPSASIASSLGPALVPAIAHLSAFLPSKSSRASHCAPARPGPLPIGTDQRWNC